MNVSNERAAEWRAQSVCEREPAKRCVSCRSFQPFPLNPNGSRTTADGVCRQHHGQIEHADRRGCDGYQSIAFGLRELVSP